MKRVREKPKKPSPEELEETKKLTWEKYIPLFYELFFSVKQPWPSLTIDWLCNNK